MCVLVLAGPSARPPPPRGQTGKQWCMCLMLRVSRASLQYAAHEGGTRTTAVAGGRLKVQTAYGDSVELVRCRIADRRLPLARLIRAAAARQVEEYDQETDELQGAANAPRRDPCGKLAPHRVLIGYFCPDAVRKWREKTPLGGWRDWFYEIGEAPVVRPRRNPAAPASAIQGLTAPCDATEGEHSAAAVELAQRPCSLSPRSASAVAALSAPPEPRGAKPLVPPGTARTFPRGRSKSSLPLP